MRKFLLIISLLISVCFGQTRVGITNQFGYEGSTPFAGIPTVVGRIVQTDSVSREGVASARIEVLKSDPMIANGARSEMNLNETALPTTPYEQWFGLSYYIPTNWINENPQTSTDILAQWHSDSGNPPIAFGIMGIVANPSSSHWYIQTAPAGGGLTDLGVVTKGVWTDVVFHIKWSTTGTGTNAGLVEVWINTVKLGSWTGVTYPTGQAAGPFWKWGLYKWPWNTGQGEGQPSIVNDRVFYLDAVRVGDGTSNLQSVSPGSTNTAPNANAGSPQTILLPTNSVTLNGTGTPISPATSISKYTWVKVSGGAATIASPASASTAITGLVQGVYVFGLTVTDNNGLVSAQSTVTITVNQKPVANAGTPQTIGLPINTVTLTGTGTAQPGGSITTYAWTKTSGGAATITKPSSATTTVTGLVAGTYVFTLTVTDNNGNTNTSTVQITVNNPPIANAGANQVITLPVNTVTLSGSGTAVAPATSITAFHWVGTGKLSYTITTPNAAKTTVTGLTQGVYVFNFTVTDNNGLTNTASTQVTVNAAAATTPPTVSAGSNQVLTLPTNGTTVTGTATPNAPSTSIKTYLWSYVSGPATFSIANPGSASTAITGLVQGVYVFRLTATDNNNLSSNATVQITVNQKPTVNAGAAQTILLPTNNVTLTGTATAQTGATIVSYLWTKLSGPATFTITTPTAKTTTVTGLVQGVYVFTLTATDNNGNAGSATVTITVNQKPTANAGSNQNITLPVNSVTLTGSGTAQSGATITAYRWTKTAGPTTFTITTPNAASTTVTGLIQGTYVFTLTVTESKGNTGVSTVTVTVNKANSPPISNAGLPSTITLPVNSVNLIGLGTPVSPATSITNYLWTKTSGPAFYTITSATSANTSVTSLVAGTYVFTLTVTDNNGLKGSSTVTITVKSANKPPTANAGANRTIQLPVNSLTLTGTGTPIAPATSISHYLWTKTAGPTTFTITSPASSSTTVTGLVQGVYTFTLTVTDNNGLTGTDFVTVTVNAANQSPTANPGSPQTITLPVSSVNLTGSGTFFAPATSVTTFAWVKISGPASGTITAPSSANTSVTGLTAGTYVYRLTVTDNNGLTGSGNVTITVNPANLPPTANAGSPQTITLPTNTISLTGSGTPILPATSIVSYAWSQTFGPAATITSPGSVTTTVTSLVAGTYIFQLIVTDNNGLTGSSTVQISVNPAPNPPIVNAGSNQTLLLPTNSATLTGSATAVSPATSISNYLWTKLSGPATYTIASPTTASTGISNLVQGVYVFNLMATDNNGNASSSTVQITVNQIPTVNAGSAQVILLPLNAVTLSGSASAQSGGTIASYLWTKLSGPATFSISSPTTVLTGVTGLVQGIYVFNLMVTDNIGNSNSATVQITVNQKPVSNAGANQNINLPTNSVLLNGSGTAQPGGSIVSYAWSKTSGPNTFTIVPPASASTSITNLIEGTYVFTLLVTDNNGNTGTSNVIINVSATVPSVNPGSPQTITLPVNSITLNGTASPIAPATSIVSYLWTKISGPTPFNILSPNSASTIINGLTNGVYVFKLTVTDNLGVQGSAPITITVQTFLEGCNCIPYGVNGKRTIIVQVNGGSPYKTFAWGNRFVFDSLPRCISPTAESPDVTVTLPTNTINLTATATGHNGSGISSYHWSQVSGNTATLVNTDLPTCNIGNLKVGGYVFDVFVKDSCGASVHKSVNVTVIPAQPRYITNVTPVYFKIFGIKLWLTGIVIAYSDGTLLPVSCKSYIWDQNSKTVSVNTSNGTKNYQ